MERGEIHRDIKMGSTDRFEASLSFRMIHSVRKANLDVESCSVIARVLDGSIEDPAHAADAVNAVNAVVRMAPAHTTTEYSLATKRAFLNPTKHHPLSPGIILLTGLFSWVSFL